MTTPTVESIEALFAKHDGDGVFACPERDLPFLLVRPENDRANFIYTTKPNTLLRCFTQGDSAHQFGLIGRYGLPHRDDALLLERVIANSSVLFAGDADPVDFLIFLWIREMLPCNDVDYVAITDFLGTGWESGRWSSLHIPLASSEKEALEEIATIEPDFSAIVGALGASLWAAGQKIELEGAMGSDGRDFLEWLQPLE
jgi:hypothetical protein